MGTEKSERIQTSILNRAEKVALVWLAERQPRWVTSDMLTWFGVFGSVVCAVGFALGNINLNYLWISCLGLFINWYGDSLDGTLARVRQTQRPKYGFFIDHSLDAITVSFMCAGAGLSPLFRLDIALLVLALYLILSIYTYIGTIIKGEFRLTYASMGPTEFRLIIILLNVLYMYVAPLRHWSCCVGSQQLGLFDVVGLVIALVLATMWTSQFLKDRKVLSELDPIKKPTDNK
ncbi:MAG: CDP-alcohol phosphatidyltransferase family protein [Bacteroidaceae bacterium]|nr:CDP-alcohol phosphatidyltransferase family protein [Bacteroidaceae bacterium]